MKQAPERLEEKSCQRCCRAAMHWNCGGCRKIPDVREQFWRRVIKGQRTYGKRSGRARERGGDIWKHSRNTGQRTGVWRPK